MTIQRAKASMGKRKDRYVVGYVGRKNIVFGQERAGKMGYQFTDACKPLTIWQAKRLLATMPCSNAAIFELRPIAINR